MTDVRIAIAPENGTFVVKFCTLLNGSWVEDWLDNDGDSRRGDERVWDFPNGRARYAELDDVIENGEEAAWTTTDLTERDFAFA